MSKLRWSKRFCDFVANYRDVYAAAADDKGQLKCIFGIILVVWVGPEPAAARDSYQRGANRCRMSLEVQMFFYTSRTRSSQFFLISKDGKKMSQNNIYPKIYQINANQTNEQKKMFWEDIFNQAIVKKVSNNPRGYLRYVKFWPYPLQLYVQLIFPTKDDSRKLTILHKDLSINKFRPVKDQSLNQE